MSPTEQEFARSHDALADALLTSATVRRRLDAAGQNDEAALLNVAQFAILFNFDLSCLLRDMRARKNAWHTKLHARYLVLTMFECVNNFDALLGKDFRRLVGRITSDPAHLGELNQIGRQRGQFRDRYYKTFKGIRDGLAAHREHDAQLYIDRLAALKVKQIENAAYEILQWLTRLHAFVASLLRSRRGRLHASQGAA